MGHYRKVKTAYWQGELAEANRGDTDAHAVAFYLMTCPATNDIGAYRMSLATLSDDLGIPSPRASEALRKLSERGFCTFDERFRMVFVTEFGRHEYGETPNLDDNRVKSLKSRIGSMLDVCPKSLVWKAFWERYGESWSEILDGQEPPNRSPPEALSKPSGTRTGRLLCQDQDQDQDQDQETPQAPQGDVPSSPAVAPRWAVAAAKGNGTKPQELARAVCSCIESVTQKPVDPQRAKTSATPIVALWRALGHPDLAEFSADFQLVARACRECPAPLFARDVRAEGWPDGTDRHRDVATVATQKRWDARLDLARRWANGEPMERRTPRRVEADPVTLERRAREDAEARAGRRW